MSNFTDDPIDLDDSLACEPGGNQLVKKKKKAGYLSWYDLMESVCNRLLNERVENIVLYHGTSLDNLPSIQEKGLEARVPGFYGGIEKGVYLTPNINLAARYALTAAGDGNNSDSKSGNYPIVLEISVSKPRRIKKMTYDPLDREESKYENDGYDDDEMFYFINDMEELLDEVNKSYNLEKISSFHKYGSGLSLDMELDELEGVSIYNLIADNTDATPSQVAKVVNKILKPGQQFVGGHLELSKSGTFHRTRDYYETREQLIYPEDLHSATIKAIYIKSKNFPDLLGDIIEIEPKMIPGDAIELYNRRDQLITYLYNFINYEKDFEDQDTDDLAERSKDVGFDEMAQAIHSQDLEEMEELLHVCQDIQQEELYQDIPFEPKGSWTKIDPKLALKLSLEKR